MAANFFELGHTWLVHGKPVTPMFDEDVFELIRDNVCDDCADYVREMFSPEAQREAVLNITDNEILKNGYCSGECDKVLETQEHYENILKDIKELADEVYQKILEGYQIGSSRRTKKEQFALDKVIAIHNLIQKNT